VRRWGTATPVTRNDRFHIGSDTKAMTGLLAAMLVEQGKLSWDTTSAAGFPDLAPTMDAALRGATLTQLLSHTSGLPGDSEAIDQFIAQSFVQPGNLDSLRAWIVKQIAPRPLASPPGSKFEYSNTGYVFIGALLERLTGKTWEELVVERIFAPFGFTSAGFGPAATLGRIDATLGHLPVEGGPPQAMLAGPNGDNPMLIGPAGTVHLSVLEFAAWAGWQAGEGRRAPALVKPETLRRMHRPVVEMLRPDAAPGTPPTGRYGLGWGELRLPFSTLPFVTHTGSNTMNLAFIMLQPAHDFAMVAMTNIGGTRADAGLREVVAKLYGSYGPERA
jgi:CubicO group peptidase (beta-lactamase class C family)